MALVQVFGRSQTLTHFRVNLGKFLKFLGEVRKKVTILGKTGSVYILVPGLLWGAPVNNILTYIT